MINIWLRILPLLIMLLLTIALAMGLFNRNPPSAIDTLNNGKVFPDFTIASLGKDTMFSPKLFGGRVLVVNAFASWCEPCAAEHDLLMELAQKVNIYGVAWKDKPEAVLRYLQERGNPFQEVGVDELGDTTIKMFLTGVPETFILNKKGEIVLHYKAPLTEEVIKTLILPLIIQLNNENISVR